MNVTRLQLSLAAWLGLAVAMHAADGAATSAAPAPARAYTATHTNVAYGPDSQNRLDVWQPTAPPQTPMPVLVFIHGGGFIAGARTLTHLQRAALAHGIAAISISYRLAGPEGLTALDCMQDAALAIQFIRSQAKEWRIAPDRVAVTGSSAGGCIALWLALHDDLADPKSDDPIRRLSTRPTVALPQATPVTFDPAEYYKRIGGPRQIHSALRPAFDITDIDQFTNDPAARARMLEVTGLTHATADDPPLMFVYGSPPPAEPHPPHTSENISIHSARHGILALEVLRPLGVECHLYYQTRGAPDALDPVAFLQLHLGLVGAKKAVTGDGQW
jgi:acetyl esterase/lipase